MPTGYTYHIADGNVTTLRDFAMLCARAFGATISMRDEPTDVPIPTEFKASTYHLNELATARVKLDRLKRMSPSEAQREMQQEHAKSMARWRELSIKDAKKRVRYLSMIQQVQAWCAPTAEHVELKDFMLQQLQDSMNFDCGGKYIAMPRLQRWPDWLRDRIAKAQRDIQYHADHQAENERRASTSTAWISQLRQSLPE